MRKINFYEEITEFNTDVNIYEKEYMSEFSEYIKENHEEDLEEFLTRN